MEVVDPTLSVIEEEPEAQRAQEGIAAVLRIGVACSAESPVERMSMEDVAKALHHIRNNTFCLPQDRTTIGYEQEYGMGGDASIAGDVYSYGILLIELFTARRPTDAMFTDGHDLHSFAEMALPNHVMEVVDPVLSGIERLSEAQRAQECIASALRIGIACSAESPGERMSMEDVAKAMHHIINNTFGLPREKTTIGHLQGTDIS